MSTIEKKKKNYVKGSTKEVTFSNGGTTVHLDIKVEGAVITTNGKLLPNEAGYVKLSLSKLPAPDQYGNTHTLYENDWKPSPKAVEAKAGQEAKPFPKAQPKDDLPF